MINGGPYPSGRWWRGRWCRDINLFNFQDASRGGRHHREEQAVRSYCIHSRLTSRRLLEGADGRTHSAAREYRTDDAIRPPHLLRAAQHAIVCAKENHEARHRNAHKLAKSSHGAQGTDIAGHMAELVIPKVHRPQRTHDGATYSAVGHTRVTWRLLDCGALGLRDQKEEGGKKTGLSQLHVLKIHEPRQRTGVHSFTVGFLVQLCLCAPVHHVGFHFQSTPGTMETRVADTTCCHTLR